MHYQHAYHAGNLADVHKHVVLVALLQMLVAKDKPFHVLDTHAGAGRYALTAEAAQKTGEYHDGIGKLFSHPAEGEGPLARYLALVRAENPSGELRHYPGSPVIADAMLRPGDRLTLHETAPTAAAYLRAHCPRAEVQTEDGYRAVHRLPPPEKRGLVLIDPAFERRDEFDAQLAFVDAAQARYAGGCIALWYPIKQRHAVQRFRRRLAELSTRPVLDAWLESGAKAEGQMVGSGVAIVAPPWGLEAHLRSDLQRLGTLLSASARASAGITWLRDERGSLVRA